MINLGNCFLNTVDEGIVDRPYYNFYRLAGLRALSCAGLNFYLSGVLCHGEKVREEPPGKRVMVARNQILMRFLRILRVILDVAVLTCL